MGAIKSDAELVQIKFLNELLADTRPTVKQLLLIHQTILEVKERIMANVSPQLAFERLAIKVSQW